LDGKGLSQMLRAQHSKKMNPVKPIACFWT